MKKLAIILAAVIVLVIGLSVTGCKVVDMGDDSEKLTRTYDYTDFTEIDIGHAFELEVIPSDDYSITITATERVFDKLDVRKTGDRLKIEVTGWTFSFKGMKAVITMPELEGLYLSGATRTEAMGFSSDRDLDIEISGASSLDMDITAAQADIEVSGASRVKGDLTATGTSFDVSGASSLDLEGTGGDARGYVSGASRVYFEDYTLEDVDIELSGASTVKITVTGTLDAEISGASTLRYGGDPDLGSIESSGGSSFEPL